MDIKIERHYDIFFMEQDGSEEIRLTSDMFPKGKKIGFQRRDISVWFYLDNDVVKSVTISSNAKLVKKKTLSQVETEDEEEVRAYLKIRCKKDLRSLIMFMTPTEKRRVKKVGSVDLSPKKKEWQWDFRNYYKRIIKTSRQEMTSDQARTLLAFFGGKKYE